MTSSYSSSRLRCWKFCSSTRFCAPSIERVIIGCVEHLAVLRAHPVHEPRDALGPEEAHQVVFEREEELRRARIALTARAAAQLPVDAPRSRGAPSR